MAEEKTENAEKREKTKADDNVVFVGKKPTMSYVLAVITQFSEGAKEVHLKARGRSISRAVDVAEVVKNRFINELKRKIDIGTEKITGEKGTDLNVSTINIVLSK
jgi:DNA-binding protein Alba